MNRRQSPNEALAQAFTLMVEHAGASAALSHALTAMRAEPVVFRGEDAIAALDPVLLAMKGPELFRETLLTFTAEQLRCLADHHNLALVDETRNHTAGQLTDLLWRRAEGRIRNLRRA